MVDALQSGKFGECPNEVEEYKKKCNVLFPFCVPFMAASLAKKSSENHETATYNGTPDNLIDGEV